MVEKKKGEVRPLKDLTPQKILDAARELARLQNKPRRDQDQEDKLVARIHYSMPTRNAGIIIPFERRVPYGIRVSVSDMANELYRGDGINHTGQSILDVDLIEFQRGKPENPVVSDPNKWYLYVMDPRMGWTWYIGVEDLQAAGHKGNPLPQTVPSSSSNV